VIDRVDERLEAWASAALEKEKVAVTFAPLSGAAPGKRGLGFHLLEVLPTPTPRTPKRPPLQLTLRYLVTADADTPREAHRLLGTLAFAALENPEFEVEVEPLAPAAWTAIGAAMRPAIVLRIPLRKDRPEPPVHRVRMPLVLRNAPMRPWAGLVVGPGDLPIVGARVESPDLGQAVETDLRGRFRFPGVPVGMPMKRLRVSAKGLVLDVNLERPAAKDAPVLIRMDALEE